ncbi:M13 family metallopeptidase [Demequina muriae]|uniref:M13-type metalloendopeptidase n=1 Tax=Demequina muriae TaxID=3051664 RepID=A0ABT8GEC9_9MICO|nr:M13-type metalloendopeptidase [Demequina sp. EGI L300058]MDN4479787.1 M13-type metalloendopeptidase [Demequina sp. EGI L300058]
MALHSGIDQSEFSPTVRPQDDFFRYVSGPWAESHVIPDDRAADGSFYTLRDEAEKHTRAIIEAADPESQIGGLYASFMDVERANALGTTPLEEDFVAIADAQDRAALAVTMGALQRTGVGGAVGYYVFADKNDPDKNVVYLSQYGLGLPDEAYYREDAHAETREKYVAHIDRMAALTGVGFTGEGIMALETALASHHWDNVKTREAELTHNPTTLDRLVAEAPGFDWRAWADAIHLPEAAHDLLIAGEPSFFEAFAQLWAETAIADWQSYLRWRVVNSRAPYLTEEISQANFSFYGTVLSGATQQRERWKRGVGFVEAVAGELVGQEYVKEHFPPTHKAHMDRLVANLIEAYRQSITQLDWMTPSTKQRALDKLAQFTPKIGYPEKWRDFTGLEVSPHDLVGNMRASSRFDEDWEWSKIGKPVDRSEWLMTPQTVNAYYLPLANEIAFPAAILQPPFFHPDADDAVNYGGIGSVIGHEIGHGFDDQGSKYDGRGKLEDWWTEADRAAFMERANRLIDQYNGYSPKQLSDEHVVNGALTVGENIGDLAGVEIALKAYEISLGHPIAEAPEVDGLTATQRFFIGYALTERMVARDESLVTRLAMDPHSPSEFRVNGIVRNVGAWYEAFEVTEEDELWLDPEARVSIW